MIRPPKHHAVVCGIGKDEDRYIVEWIAYHLAIGFDHVFLYDNMSHNPIETLLNQRILRSKVTVIRWPTFPGENPQTAAYKHFLHTYRERCEWAALIDLDEFINLKRDATIAGFLHRFPEASAVSINWRIFGSSGERTYRRAPMMERFPNASELSFPANKHVKTIFRLARTSEIYCHHGTYDAGPVQAPGGAVIESDYKLDQDAANYDIAQINHYFVRSADEWELKNLRGNASGRIRSPAMYGNYDRNEVPEPSILVRLPATRKLMKAIRFRDGLARRYLKPARTVVNKAVRRIVGRRAAATEPKT